MFSDGARGKLPLSANKKGLRKWELRQAFFLKNLERLFHQIFIEIAGNGLEKVTTCAAAFINAM